MDKYLRVNAIKRKFIASATRHKIAGYLIALTFSIRLIDAVFIRPPQIENQNSSYSGQHNMRFEEEQKQIEAQIEAMVRQRVSLMDDELERLRRKGEDAERARIHENSLEEMRKKNKKKRSDRSNKRGKSKTSQEGLSLKDQEAEFLA